MIDDATLTRLDALDCDCAPDSCVMDYSCPLHGNPHLSFPCPDGLRGHDEGCPIRQTLAEIRRLREKAENLREARDQYFTDLAAHQAEVERLTTQLEKCRWHSSLEELEDRVDTAMAVVRELAKVAEECLTNTRMAHLSAPLREKVRAKLAHPLVRQAREEKVQ